MKYTHYNTDDFLRDEYFKQWVFNPDRDSNFFFESFLENHPEKLEAVAEARAFLLSISFKGHAVIPPTREEKQELFDRIMQARASQGDPSLHTLTPKTSGTERRLWFRAAAVLLLAVVVSLFWFYKNAYHQGEQPVQPLITKTTTHGQKLLIHLHDGTLVKLNAGSSITYPEEFGKNREVSLQGEAFFDVAKDKMHPFIIKTGNVRTRVLGTSFNINASKEEEVEVAVLTGKVAVDNLNDDQDVIEAVTLLPYEMIQLQPTVSGYTKKQFEYDEIFSWKDDVIYFKNANITEVLRTLEHWYGVEFDVQKKIENTKDFSGSYKNKSLETVLEGVSFAFGFDFEINKTHVTIK